MSTHNKIQRISQVPDVKIGRKKYSVKLHLPKQLRPFTKLRLHGTYSNKETTKKEAEKALAVIRKVRALLEKK